MKVIPQVWVDTSFSPPSKPQRTYKYASASQSAAASSEPKPEGLQ